MYELGGHAVYLGPEEIGLSRRESVPDVARVLSRFVHGIVARTFRHADLLVMAEMASVPVINALSDFEHPCQGLADLLTMRECFPRLAGLRVTYVGDGNNVARTLVYASGRVGLHLTLASPPGHACETEIVEAGRREAERLGGSITQLTDPREAACDADVLYADVWTSMGQESQAAQRRQAFEPYRIDDQLLRLARPTAVVMHDLPAHRGEEITEDVIDGPRSVVFQQAENRLHAQKAILLWLLGRPVGDPV
jgi:ornithine carbamoyltransferase